MRKTLLTLFCTLAMAVTVSAYDPAEQKALSLETGGYYEASVRNDVTGRWRVFIYHDPSIRADDFAERYYRAYFNADDEIHFVVNPTLGETTRITYAFGSLFVTTFSYVDNEEHDAKMMPAGDMLRENILEIEANDYEAQKELPEGSSGEEGSTDAVSEGPNEAVEASADGEPMESTPEEEGFSKGEIKRVQKALKKRGYYSGKKTGKLDDATRTAIRKYQGNAGMDLTGRLTQELYDALV